MVLDFIKSRRHQDFLMAVHQACSHLEDLIKVDHPEAAVSEELASAISWHDALRHHLQMDAEALLAWHDEVSRLLARFPIAKAELELLDPLDASMLYSLLNRAETTLACALKNYPDAIKFQKEGQERSPNFKGYVESMHRNLTEARSYVIRMEDVIARLAQKQAQMEFHSELERDARRTIHPAAGGWRKPGIAGSIDQCNSPRIEISSHMANQMRHGEVPSRELEIALKKAVNFVMNGNTPSTPWHGEPHCYGGAPEHLNGVVVGGQQRMIYYLEDKRDQNMPASTIRICCWISPSCHHDAFLRLRHQNLYRRIISNDRSIKMTRKDFDGFQSMEWGGRS